MNQNPGTELVAANAAPKSAKAKKIARVAGAAVFTFAMVGAFALPATAFTQPDADVTPIAAEFQSHTVSAGPALVEIDDVPLEVDTAVVEQERIEKARKKAEAEAAKRSQSGATSNNGSGSGTSNKSSQQSDVPAGSGAAGLVEAAYAQLGDSQDCTALVERSLRAIGISVGDLGPAQFSVFGPNVSYVHGETALAPGDILIWGNAHVAIYAGGGSVIHGGWTGYTTAVAGLNTIHGFPTSVVRMS